MFKLLPVIERPVQLAVGLVLAIQAAAIACDEKLLINKIRKLAISKRENMRMVYLYHCNEGGERGSKSQYESKPAKTIFQYNIPVKKHMDRYASNSCLIKRD